MQKLFLLIILLFSCAIVHAKPRGLVTNDSSYIVYNQSREYTVDGKNIETVRPIASITKLMTAIVYLDANLDLNQKIKILPGSWLPRSEYTRRELLAAMLVNSNNAAAETLANDYPGGRSAFISAMNQRSKDMGSKTMQFHDPSGLTIMNVATINDIVTLGAVAYHYPLIKQFASQQKITINAHLKKTKKSIELYNTNRPLLSEFNSISLSKTGFTQAAGWCVVMVIEKAKERFVVAILGSKSKQNRLAEARKLLNTHTATQQNIRDYVAIKE